MSGFHHSIVIATGEIIETLASYHCFESGIGSFMSMAVNWIGFNSLRILSLGLNLKVLCLPRLVCSDHLLGYLLLFVISLGTLRLRKGVILALTLVLGAREDAKFIF